MKKIAVALALALTLAACSGGGSNNSDTDSNKNETSTRFIEICSDFRNSIYVDTETNVMYLWHSGGYSGCLVVMVDENGKPLLWEGAATND